MRKRSDDLAVMAAKDKEACCAHNRPKVEMTITIIHKSSLICVFELYVCFCTCRYTVGVVVYIQHVYVLRLRAIIFIISCVT